MNIDTELATYLGTLASLPVQQGTISEDKVQPYVWFQREQDILDTHLDGTAALQETTYAVEVSGFDIDAVQATADTIKATLNGYRGNISSAFVLAVFVEDVQDDYQYRTLNEDKGNHVSGFRLRIIHT